MGLVAMTTLKANWVGIYHCPEGGGEGSVSLAHEFGCQGDLLCAH